MASKIKIKRGTTAQWADSSTNDTTLAPGQPGVEYCTDGKTKLKIGPHTEDGSSTEWSEIDYISADGTEIVKTSATGKSYTINDCAESSIISLNGYGESTQDGTPTPDSPAEIVSVENPVINVCGKNLIPATEISQTVNGITFTSLGDGTITMNGTSTATASITIPFQSSLHSGTYTLSFNNSEALGNNNVYALVRDDLGAFENFILYANVQNATKTTTINQDKTNIMVIVLAGTTLNNFTIKPQLELGSVATSYEPYIEPQTVTVPYTFRGLKNTTTGQWSARDELRVGDGKVEIVRNIKSLTITAENSDSYSFLSGNISGDICRMHSYKNGPTPLFNDMTQDASINYVLCNLFQHYKGLQATAGYEGISGTTYTGNIYINVSLTRIGLEPDTTVGDAGIRAAFWNWIKDKGCEIDYILAEPVVEDITATEAGQALLALKTNYPNTSVISDIDCNIEYLTVDSIVDQKYNPNSVYPQSGKAVAEAIQTVIGSGSSVYVGQVEQLSGDVYENFSTQVDNGTLPETVKVNDIYIDTLKGFIWKVNSVSADGIFMYCFGKVGNNCLFGSTGTPPQPYAMYAEGQLYFDTSTNKLYIRSTNSWEEVSGSTENSTTLTWKTGVLKFYNNSSPVEVANINIKYAEDNNFIYVNFGIVINNLSIQRASVKLDIDMTGINSNISVNNLSYSIIDGVNYETFFANTMDISPSKILVIHFTDINNNIDFTGKELSIYGTYLFKK